MLVAILHGKLSRDQENMEDILTSNVFGTFKYLSASKDLVQFLSKATSLTGEFPPELSSDSRVSFEFWPWLNEPGLPGCEPDLLLRIADADRRKYVVLIEAKYRSGKSLGGDDRNYTGDRLGDETKVVRDQLAREWQQLQAIASKESADPILIYLTADYSCPKEEIQASQKELRARTGTEAKIYWLSWRHLAAVIGRDRDNILGDLGALLERLNLTFFEGFSKFEVCSVPRWNFSFNFDWECLQKVVPIRWDLRS